MKMTGREPPISISDGNLIMIGVVIMTVFVIVLILVMINDYRLSRKSLEKEIQFRRFRQARTILYLYTVVLPSFGRFGIVVTKRVFILNQQIIYEKKVSIIIHPSNRSSDVYCLH